MLAILIIHPLSAPGHSRREVQGRPAMRVRSCSNTGHELRPSHLSLVLFDHVGSAGEQRSRNFDAERFASLVLAAAR
jgi:hypothetical protein